MFARMGLRSLILVMLALVVVLAAPVVGQTDTIQMVVRGNQTINARSCAQLSCAVVVTFAPGTELECSGTTEGDTVNGSDQWVEVAYEGGTVYIHSSLVEEMEPADAEAAETNSSTLSRAAEELAELAAQDREVSTARWNNVTLRGFTLKVPSTWRTPEELLADDDFWRQVARDSGKDAVASLRAWYEEEQQSVNDGELDLSLMDPFGSGSLDAINLGRMDGSLENVRQRMESYLVDTAGAEIVVSEVRSVEAGEIYHVIALLGNEDHAPVWDMYYVRAGGTLFMIELDMRRYDASRYLPYASAIAESLEVIEDSKW